MTREKQVQTRLEPEVWRAAQKASKRKHWSLSTWIMQAVVGKLRQGGYLDPVQDDDGPQDKQGRAQKDA